MNCRVIYMILLYRHHQNNLSCFHFQYKCGTSVSGYLYQWKIILWWIDTLISIIHDIKHLYAFLTSAVSPQLAYAPSVYVMGKNLTYVHLSIEIFSKPTSGLPKHIYTFREETTEVYCCWGNIHQLPILVNLILSKNR